MSRYSKTEEIPKYAEVGRLLSKCLHEARKQTGQLICPNCCLVFDATHLIKCPDCRTLIGETFKKFPPEKSQEKPQQEKGNGALARKNRQAHKRSTKQPVTQKRRRKSTPRNRGCPQATEKVELELDFFTQGYMEYKG